MKKVLVTGGAGFIGQHLVRRLANQNYQVGVVDQLALAGQNNLPQSVKFYSNVIQDQSLAVIFQQFRPKIVFHLAADNRVVSSAGQTLSSNVIGTFNVLRLCKQIKVKQLIFTSSAAVYGEAQHFPIKETAPTRPISAYGVSKLTGELYCRLFQKHFSTTVFRFANVYGPGQNSSSEGGVVAIFIRQLLDGKTPSIFGTGRQLRDFIYVDDVVDAMMASITQPQTITLNIGSGKTTSIKQLLNLTAELINKPVLFNSKPARPVEIKNSLLDHSLAIKQLAWRPRTSLKQGLEQTIDYFKVLETSN